MTLDHFRSILCLTVFLTALNGSQAQDKSIVEATSSAADAQKNGLLSVYSDPPGGSVYLNDSLINHTPFSQEMPAGVYSVRIVMTGWEDALSPVEIKGHKRTIVSALLRKPMPKDLKAGDIGRTHMERMFYEDIRKPETKQVFVKPEWPKKAKNASLLLIGIGAVTALVTLESKTFSDETNLATQVSIASLGLGMTGLVVFYVVDEHSGEWVAVKDVENIKFNRKRKAEIEENNRKAKTYNDETAELLEKEYLKRRKQIEEFNEGRGITIEIY